MTAFLPPSTNGLYRGAPFSAHVLTLLAVLTIVPGCIHVFLPDGGAGVIAGIELGACGPVIIALFAWAGATQIALGLVMLAVSLRYRSLVPLLLGVVALERALHALNAWVTKSGSGHHPPEHYGVLVALPLILVALALALRTGRPPARPNVLT